ncbi:MAG: hypothetical protein HRU24_02525 [Gammaproteobacteria bacterium]|nr:hypothetical protein [Gammaproteobacteria bacterium]
MSAQRKLLKTWGFWLAFSSPIVIGLLLAWWMAYVDGVYAVNILRWNNSNILFAYDFFKIPLLIAALSFPLVALITANHRSGQSVALMSLQRSQNYFSNHFTHLERFEEYLNTNHLLIDNVKSPRIIHKCFYPRSRGGDLDIDNKLITSFKEKISRIECYALDIKAIDGEFFTNGELHDSVVIYIKEILSFIQVVSNKMQSQDRMMLGNFHQVTRALFDYVQMLNHIIDFDSDHSQLQSNSIIPEIPTTIEDSWHILTTEEIGKFS